MTVPRAEIRVVAVSRLANYIAGIFTREKAFGRIGVRGEISNHREVNGNVYFDLKDRDALLNCVAFSEAAAMFPALANGDEVVAYGTVQTFPKASRYQLRVFDVASQGGVGALHTRYEQLKARLAAEGLFEQARKRPLPRFPFRVALVTSQSADGARDFITQAAARAPHVEIVVVPTPVQGQNAAPEIVRAIARAAAMDVDLLVIARGGGSFEDLFAFSDERVVRALAAARVPTVSAIGHEADSPLTDFVADHRAATPSAAAQTVLPRRDDLLGIVAEYRRALARDVDRVLATRRQSVDMAVKHLTAVARERVRRCGDRLVDLERRLGRVAPATRLAERRERFGALQGRLSRGVAALMSRRALRVETLTARLARVVPDARVGRAAAHTATTLAKLEAAMQLYVQRRLDRTGTLDASLENLNPAAILQRGYAIVRSEDGRVLTDPDQAEPGSRVAAELAHGVLTARVEREGAHGGRQINLF